MKSEAFSNLLIRRRLASAGELDRMDAQCGHDAFRLLLMLVEKSPARRGRYAQVWGDLLNVAYVDTARTVVQPEALAMLSEDAARELGVLPLYTRDGVVTVATAHPDDEHHLLSLENHVGGIVSPVFDLPDAIDGALDIAYMSGSKLLQAVNAIRHAPIDADTLTPEQLTALANDHAIVEFCRRLVVFALSERASDIHIEPDEEGARVRLRIDGELRTFLNLSRETTAQVVNRIKITAGADIAEARLPQDGRIALDLHHRTVEIRFSSLPLLDGEKIVLRLLGQTAFHTVPSLEECGLSRSHRDSLMRVMAAPNGLFLITGPTGSGKTTTLYAALRTIVQRDINILTIENPVEYRLKGVNHCNVNVSCGLTFAKALRAALRQDPDVILVGEIRDEETASIAVQAAMTGHLVLTTLHTNNAIQSVTRLIQIGVAPYLVAASLRGAMAQRLVRQLCPDCREPVTLSAAEVDGLFLRDDPAPVVCYRAVGCRRCGGTGYRGCTAIYEWLPITEPLREKLSQHAVYSEIKNLALATGYRPMRYDGLKKVLRGLTTLDEVARVTLGIEESDDA